jgi:hypothetical protein
VAYTQADADKLRAAIATGAKRVRFQGHETEFHSLDEMRRLLADIEREVNPASAPARRTVATFVR